MLIRWTTFAGFAGVAFVSGMIAFYGVGCGDDDDGNGGPSGPDPVTVVGNVQSVLNEANTTAALGNERWLAWIAPGNAIAQDDCPVDSILACLRTNLGEQETPVETCSVVNPTTCQFQVAIELDDQIEIFFVDDRGDGEPDDPGDEPRSTLENGPPVEDVCDGQTITLTDVQINFAPTESSLALDVETDKACPTPTPTPEPTATPTPTPEPS